MAPSEVDDLFGDENTQADGARTPPADDRASDAGSAADELAIQRLLQPMQDGGDPFKLDGPIDQSGKADDAVDYEDVSDDDLPDEEPGAATSGDGPGLTDDGGTPDDTDDLFGEDDGPSTYDTFDTTDKSIHHGHGPDSFETQLTSPSSLDHNDDSVNFDPPPKEGLIQQTQEERLAKIKESCPQFQPGVIPFMNEIFRPKPKTYEPKIIPKQPKPLTHPKISLDIATDQERTFRSAGSGFTVNRSQRLEEAKARGIILDLEPEEEEVYVDKHDWTPLDYYALSTPAGATTGDMILALTDFESYKEVPPAAEVESQDDDEWMKNMFGDRPRKKQKLSDFPQIDQPVYLFSSYNNIEELIAQIGSRPMIDANDPKILLAPVEEEEPSKKRLLNGKLKHGVNGKTSLSRYNISNDHTYEALKANNQSKIRAAVGSAGVEHSAPALKCAWPYYKIKHDTAELRSFHRMPLKFGKFVGHSIPFTKSTVRKKKHMRGLNTQEIYAKTSDLSLSDNSNAMLLEYSEEYPTVLSNFGMGNRIINYYRKIDDEDTERPKRDIGETHVLLPTDESPFNRFGKVDAGEVVPTLHNSMYRAPVFKHEPKPNDFLVIRSTTGTDGTNWHLRNIDHLYVVGQELPSIDVPGPHSRRVTDANKARMTMVAHRLIKHNKNQELRLGDLAVHMDPSQNSDGQVRGKLKEILRYEKEMKVWKLKGDELLPLEEANIRAKIKPEDACLIESMHVGVRHLEDSGYAQTAEDDDEVTDEVVQQLAPWRTTKAFIEASQGKAMLQLKGAGDPSGCGMALSMIKTSMKGGFLKGIQKGPMSTSTDAMERQRKANGGHDYNVSEQEAKYAEVLDEIWHAQKSRLSDAIEHTELDEEDLHRQEQSLAVETSAQAATPGPGFDDSASMTSDARSTKWLRISRKSKDQNGQIVYHQEIIKDPRVAKEYTRRRAQKDAENVE